MQSSGVDLCGADVRVLNGVLARSSRRLRPPSCSVADLTAFYEHPKAPTLSTAILYKRASLFRIERATCDDAITNADFVWVHADFARKINVAELLNDALRCRSDEFRWIMSDRLVRPLHDVRAIVAIHERTKTMRALIARVGSSPARFVPGRIAFDDEDRFEKCRIIDGVCRAQISIRAWALGAALPPNLSALAENHKWPTWSRFMADPFETIHARICIACDVGSLDDLAFVENEYVVETPRNSEWFAVGKFWTCDRLRDLNRERNEIRTAFEREFDALYARHRNDLRRVCAALLSLDEDCFYADSPHATFPEFGNKVADGADPTFVYLAQCGYPVPIKQTRAFRWFNVKETQPHDGIFVESQWMRCVEQMTRLWGEPFVL